MRRSTIPLVITLAATVGLNACEKKTDSTKVDPDAIAAAQTVKVDKDFGDKVRAYILQHPEILIEAQQALQLKAMAEEEAVIEKQFASHKVQLQHDKRDFVINPKGKVTVVELFDYNCTYCKVIAPDIAQLARDNPDVRFVFKDYTLGNFGPTSEYAAAAARALNGKGLFADSHFEMIAQRPLTDAQVDDLLTRNGIAPASVRALEQTPEQQQYLLDVRALAKDMGINGTPAFFVEGDFVSGAQAEVLKAAIAKAKRGK
ncbi:MAG: disulfide bond formation protein DsbA [Caulobacter sp.]|nr:disulfide bond formation protein DsbA [Caulobacter sp.]